MIRREITTATGQKLWLLISQVKHARVSGELTRNWREEFSDDVINAIAHHDDGWAAWEADPKLKPELGAPFSFLEMPVPVALVIWDHSIAAAGQFGPLAAYIVAGHFYNLLNNSDNAKDPLAVAWLTAKRKQRTGWLNEWVRADPSHKLEYAKQAQHMLLIADLFSLWLCCDCPAEGASNIDLEHSPMKLQTSELFNQFQFAVQSFSLDVSEDDNRLAGLNWTVAVHPYPCTSSPLPLSADCIAAPVKKYATWQELQAASWPMKLRWRLVDDDSRNGSPT
jgi:hypothetical protein